MILFGFNSNRKCVHINFLVNDIQIWKGKFMSFFIILYIINKMFYVFNRTTIRILGSVIDIRAAKWEN